MKTFNVKIAAQAFCALLALNAMLFTLLYQVPCHWSRLLWWIFNWPGYKLGDVAGRYLVHQGFVFHESSLVIVIGLVCTLIWSVIIGFLVRRKLWSNKSLGNSRCPCQLRLIYEIVRHIFISTPRSAAVPELWTLARGGSL